MKIGVIGAGHVGLVTGACFAHLGNDVICMDSDGKKIEALKRGRMPFYEPGLDEMVKQNAKLKRLIFSDSIKNTVKNTDIIFICVGTPPRESGDPDLSYVENVGRDIGRAMSKYKIVVEKSTVPVETGTWIHKTIDTFVKKNVKFDVASNPEFLREGAAIYDFMQPDRVVIGVESAKAKKMIKQLYDPIKAPIVFTDIKSAEIIKHASNSFLSMKISFINALARVCEAAGADIEKVADGIGMDKRIGRDFLNAGIGFGGFCFPKDLAAFIRISEKLGVDFRLLKEVLEINEEQKRYFVKLIENNLWNLNNKTIGVLGLSFKPDTDDMRFAPSVDIIEELKREGAKIQAYDPQAMSEARKVLKGVKYCKTPYEAVKGADALAILTGWDEFKKLDMKKIKKLLTRPLIVDGRNIYSPALMKEQGFTYVSIGRRAVK